MDKLRLSSSGAGRPFPALCILILAALLLAVSPVLAQATDSMTIESSQESAQIGDIVKFKGKAGAGMNTAPVYLFITGPDLPESGTTLEGDVRHARIPHHQIYSGGAEWDYSWDTGLVVGGLDEGIYKIHVTTLSDNEKALSSGNYAVTEIEITDPKGEKKESPSGIIYIISAPLIAGLIFLTRNYSGSGK
ncbi:hypothetical protein [Methanoplanus endosymbiosus]|uniref:Uncharacterized protein n=1 Tax=Methanoplanus endosymbiosus TaxID=33865 RepID=A0A9E7TJ99_9EURY|nr:hypothetical protein [Methanoplanus endosymbiosus]UUX93403.1 hypothetical protein L6E24_04555 [Methanoplanus endosymbiosus]